MTTSRIQAWYQNPEKHLILAQFSNSPETPILTYVALLSVNVFAVAFVFIRKFFLKDTGRKLAHLDKAVIGGHGGTLSAQISVPLHCTCLESTSGVSSKAANWGHFKTGQRKWLGTVKSCTRS